MHPLFFLLKTFNGYLTSIAVHGYVIRHSELVSESLSFFQLADAETKSALRVNFFYHGKNIKKVIVKMMKILHNPPEF